MMALITSFEKEGNFSLLFKGDYFRYVATHYDR